MIRLLRGHSLVPSVGRAAFLSAAPFKSTADVYNGVNITEELSAITADEFESRLGASLQLWKEEKRKGVWLRLPIDISHLVPVAVRKGFWYHHCSHDYILLCNWLQGGKESSKLPAAPSHYVGVAGFVLNSRRELLVIQEKHGPAAGQELWKLPGGLLDQREDIAAGVTREVKEETGIQCTFDRIVAMVEGHRGRGPARESASDLYVVSILTCDDENQAIMAQEEEIANCAWLPVRDVLKHPFYSPSNAFGVCLHTALTIYDGSRTAGISQQREGDGDTDSGGDIGLFPTMLPDMSAYGMRRGVYPVGIGKNITSVYLASK